MNHAVETNNTPSFHFYCEVLVYSLPCTSEGTCSRKVGAQLVSIGMLTVCWKTCPPNSKYVVNQKLEPLDDTSFSQPFGRIKVVFQEVVSVSPYNMIFVSAYIFLFHETQLS